MRRRAALATLTLLAALPAAAQPQPRPVPPEVAAGLPGARLQGGGRLRYFGLRVYDIWLYSGAKTAGADWAAVPLALEIEYARQLEGALIAERSLKEMRRQTEIDDASAARWLATMTQLFPDVREGDRISAVQRPGESTRFFVNGRAVGEVRDAEFTRLFIGIWLSARSSEPALREALLGSTP